MSQESIILINTLKGNSLSENRSEAAKALEKINDPEVIDALIYAVDNDQVENVIAAAVFALAEIGDERAIPHIVSVFGKTDQYLSRQCAQALGKFGAKGIEALSIALKNNNNLIRSYAIEALGATKNPVVLPLLLGAVRDPVGWVAVNAVRALGELGDPSAASTLLELMKGKTSPELIETIKRTLEKLGVDIPDSIAGAERRAKELFLSNLKALRVGMSEDEVIALVGGGVFAMGTRIVYRNQYGEFQLIIANGRLVEIPGGSLIKRLEAELSNGN